MVRPNKGKIDVAALWAEYKRTGSVELRNQLAEHYLYLAVIIANRVATRLPRSIDAQDLKAEGMIGLLRAIKNFDPSRGSRFESYAATRIHGAIIDSLRGWDWVPRLVRGHTALYRTAHATLQERLGRNPSIAEIAAELDVPLDEAAKRETESHIAAIFSLTRPDGDKENPNFLRSLDVLVDKADWMAELEQRDLAGQLISRLDTAEKTVVALYYGEGLTMNEVGKVMRLTESRVCQIHTRLIEKLRCALSGDAYSKAALKPPRFQQQPQRVAITGNRKQRFAHGEATKFIREHLDQLTGQTRSVRARELATLASKAGYYATRSTMYRILYNLDQLQV